MSSFKNLAMLPSKLPFKYFKTPSPPKPNFLASLVRISITLRDVSVAFLGITKEEANYIYTRSFELYFSNKTKEELENIKLKIHVLGCLRIINYLKKQSDEMKNKFLKKISDDLVLNLAKIEDFSI